MSRRSSSRFSDRDDDRKAPDSRNLRSFDPEKSGFNSQHRLGGFRHFEDDRSRGSGGTGRVRSGFSRKGGSE